MEEFKIEVAKASIGTGTSRRYPPHLREMAARYAKAERKKGVMRIPAMSITHSGKEITDSGSSRSRKPERSDAVLSM